MGLNYFFNLHRMGLSMYYVINETGWVECMITEWVSGVQKEKLDLRAKMLLMKVDFDLRY